MTNTVSKIDKADYMLLFLRINKVQDQLNPRTELMERVFQFEHVQNRFSPSDHIWSRDKNSVSHCYRELEQDKFYFIFAHRVHELSDVKKNGRVFHRWVWRAAVELTEKQIRLAYQFFLKNPDQPKLVSQYIDQLRMPSATAFISEFDYQGEENAPR